ncbi:Bifunctional protein GlmU [Commensalibacter sp. Nvir]|uniref:bifunctional UDP-N-acetylglucosamine diphosphorylase/glucosamine-1-phosphate N-acetyltransferase GlmU n=1 Tax=Commensalibacter sp. Nvir TaxID=3069817 RepID=UPI002D2F9BE0|nr:Bifunctional protein GlmU [Commensalibacter sp. Nvir]
MNKRTNVFPNTVAIILAAGMGTRMKSQKPKALQPLAGKPMLSYLLKNVEKIFKTIVVVIGPNMQEVAELVKPHSIVIQYDRHGTGHAALQAEQYFGENDVAILYADNPLITDETLERLIRTKRNGSADMVLMTMNCKNPQSYGRVIEVNGQVQKIVEYADANEEEKKITLCNAGVLCSSASYLSKWLHQITPNNQKKEYYLVDAVAIAVSEGKKVITLKASENELRGINSKSELAEAETVIQHRLRQHAMDNGVTMIAPETVYLSEDTKLEADVIVHPHVVFGSGVHVKKEVEIKSFCHLEQCIIEENAVIGPYARLRPQTFVGKKVHVGNFVELKSTILGEETKVNHLTYLGNSKVGEKTNIGAGTITCNYDGINKHETIIGDNTFIGSDTILVAPVEIGNKSFIAAGSVITENVPDNAFALGRSRQIVKPQAACRFNKKKSKE